MVEKLPPEVAKELECASRLHEPDGFHTNHSTSETQLLSQAEINISVTNSLNENYKLSESELNNLLT
jgi:hypothetical protein